MATDSILTTLSTQMADAVAAAASTVVQVHGRRRPASGVVYTNDVVLTTARALGREDGLRVRRPDGETLDAHLAGWDPTTGLAVLRIAGLGLVPPAAGAPPRVGHLALAVARSWSNSLTASAGIVAVIGGPLPTGPRCAIDEIIRTTAPMHDGFAGGGLLDTAGHLIGITTAATIRGLGVVIPAAIAWKTAATLLEHGSVRRGYLGIAAQRVSVPGNQQAGVGHTDALLVVGVTDASPASAGGILVGDIIVEVDGRHVESPEDLFDLLVGDRVGRRVAIRTIRGAQPIDITVTVGERPAR